MIDLTPEEALHIIGCIQGDLSAIAVSIREKLLQFLAGER